MTLDGCTMRDLTVGARVTLAIGQETRRAVVLRRYPYSGVEFQTEDGEQPFYWPGTPGVTVRLRKEGE